MIRPSFAIPVRKTCEDSHDKGVQFVLKAVPQHQTSNDSFSRQGLILFQKELKSGNLDSDFNVLKIDRNLGREIHIYVHMCFG